MCKYQNMAQASNAEKEVPSGVQEIVKKMPLEDEDENALKVQTIRYLEESRVKIYGGQYEAVLKGENVLAVECVPMDDSDDIKQEDKELKEKIIIVSSSDAEVVELEDKITMEDMSPSSLIEYTFYENGPWFLAPMSLFSLEGYRKTKFKNWKNMIENPTCEV